jgi:hypothetical protein
MLHCNNQIALKVKEIPDLTSNSNLLKTCNFLQNDFLLNYFIIILALSMHRMHNQRCRLGDKIKTITK